MRSLSEKRSETRKISHTTPSLVRCNPEVSGSNPTPATRDHHYWWSFCWFEPHRGVIQPPLPGKTRLLWRIFILRSLLSIAPHFNSEVLRKEIISIIFQTLQSILQP